MPAKSDVNGKLFSLNIINLDTDEQGKTSILGGKMSSTHIKQPLSEFNHQTDTKMHLQNTINLKAPTPKIKVCGGESK